MVKIKIGNIITYGIIYKITNKINKKVYIGQTIKSKGFKGRYDFGGEGIKRVYKSISCNKRIGKHYNSHLLRSIEKYGLDNFEVNEIFDIAFSKSELDAKEKSWIAIYDSMNREHGYNFTEGGSNGKQSEEVKKRNSLSKIGKNKLSENPNSKKVICLTTNKTFECILEASKYYDINRCSIIQSCSGKRKTGGKLEDGTKLVWMYYKDYINNKELVEIKSKEEYIIPKSKCISVKCITTGEIFNSISEASDFYGFKSNANICSCCKGKLHYCGIQSRNRRKASLGIYLNRIKY